MNRLFTYGCSFTNYIWPMWPLFFTKNFDIVYNRGKSGAGNEYIFHFLLQDLKKFNINKDDTIFIMWSGYSRFDRCVNQNYWQTDGFVYAGKSQKEIEEIDKYWSLDGSIIKAQIYINTLITMLESLEIKFKFFDAFGLFEENTEVDRTVYTKWGSIVPNYLRQFDRQRYFPCNTLQHYLSRPYDRSSYKKMWEGSIIYDGHPSINVTLDFVKTEIQDVIDFVINSEVIELGEQIHQTILDIEPYYHSWQKELDTIFNTTHDFIYDNQSLNKFLAFYQSKKNR